MKIVLVGAYGYTAQLICELLHQNNFTFSIAGKDDAKLLLLQKNFDSIQNCRSVDLRNETEVSLLVDDFDVLINCAGPFTEEASLLIGKIATSQNKVYLDITGELGFVKNSHEKFDAIAKTNHTTLLHGCAFESMCVDLVLNLIHADLGDITEVKSFYRFHHTKPSPGTRMTMKLSKFRKSESILNGRWQEINTNLQQEEIQFDDGKIAIATPYPLPEIAFAFWKFKPKSVLSYLILSKEEAMFVGSNLQLESSIEDELQKLKQRKTTGPTSEERKNQRCEISVQAKNSVGRIRTISLVGTDMYLMTAKCILESIKRISKVKTSDFGVIRPSDLFVGGELKLLNQLGMRLSENQDELKIKSVI